MLKKFALAVVLVSVCGPRATASGSDLQQIADALDVSTTKTFQFTGNGRMFSVGQSREPRGGLSPVLCEEFDANL